MSQTDSGGGADPGAAAPAPAADGAATPSTPASTPSPAAPAADTSTAPAADDVFAELADQAVFDRGYVEKLRAEGAKYRTQHRELEAQYEPVSDLVELLGSFEEGDREGWRDLMTQYRDDPVGAAERFTAVSNAILEAHGIDPATATTEQQAAAEQQAAETMTDPAAEPLTPERVEALVSERLAAERAQADQTAAVSKVFDQIREAGIDPDGAEGFSVLWRANNEHGGDLDAAIAAQKASRQSIIDDYVKSLKDGSYATPAPQGAPATASTEIKTFDDARRATQRMQDAQREAG